MLKYFLFSLAIYFAYRFIVEFAIPIYKTTKQVKKQFQGIREQQAHYQRQQEKSEEQPRAGSKVNEEDYLEFEEIK